MEQQQESQQPSQCYNDSNNNDSLEEPKLPDPNIDFSDDRTALERLAYTVSLNYNKLATSILFPVTRWHWYDTIQNTNCILGAVPSRQDLAHLSKVYNVRHVINMCAEFPGHLETMRELGMQQCWLPTKDFHTPSIGDLWRGVKYIGAVAKASETISQNEVDASVPSSLPTPTSIEEDIEKTPSRIYLHCKAGRGRSASVAICWLVYDYDLTLAQAQAILLSCRGQVDRHLRRLPEIVTFYDQVNALVQKGDLKRKTWEG